MLILGLTKTTLLDYPGRVAATLFTGGCNFRCPFCQNGNLVLKPGEQQALPEEEIFSFLNKRKGILKGVCITGGEPCLQADLPDFIQKIKEIGLLVKLDTNGSYPQMLRRLLQEGLLDYVAMDIKNCEEKYGMTAGTGRDFREAVKESVALLKANGIAKSIEYEFRTTVVRELHSKEDLLKIGRWIGGCSHYYLQQYRAGDGEIGRLTGSRTAFHAYEREEMEELLRAVNRLPEMQGRAALRGVS